MRPEFTRTQWVSLKAEDVWKNRFRDILFESHRIETETVRQGLRKIAMRTMDLDEFNEFDAGNLVLKIRDTAVPTTAFSTVISHAKAGEPFVLRTVLGRAKEVKRFMEYAKIKDDISIGQMLGYPDCCAKFFKAHWDVDGKLDLTWAAMNIPQDQTRGVVYPHPLLNPLLNRLGIRPIYHMACSMQCASSIDIAYTYLKLWKEPERSWLIETLSWPVEYSALHGAAEVRTPVLKLLHSTDYTKHERIVQLPGDRYPEEGAKGNRFPYDKSWNLHFNNGFSSEKVMTDHHAIVEKVAKKAEKVYSILDLGSGNGVLLRKLGNIFPDAGLVAIDNNVHAIIQGEKEFDSINFYQRDLLKTANHSDMIVLMPGRMLECAETSVAPFVEGLRFRYLLLYAYAAYAHQLQDLKEKYWPDLKELIVEQGDNKVAMLLEAA